MYVHMYIKPRIHSPRLLTNRAPYALGLKLYVMYKGSITYRRLQSGLLPNLEENFELCVSAGRADSPRWGGRHEVLSLCQH